MNTDQFCDWIDEVYYAEAQGLAPEHLAVPLDNFYSVCLEITLNLGTLKGVSLVQHLEILQDIFNNFKEEYKAVSGSFVIEYCRSGIPHLHGYIETQLHYNTYSYETAEILKMYARSIFLKLPKKYYKQFKNATVNEYLKLFKTPALVLNIKNYLAKGWQDYMNKNAL